MFLYTNIIVVFMVLDIMESPAFKKFGDLLENLFEFDDECDVPSFHDLGKLCVLCSLVILGHYIFCGALCHHYLGVVSSVFSVHVVYFHTSPRKIILTQ